MTLDPKILYQQLILWGKFLFMQMLKCQVSVNLYLKKYQRKFDRSW
jgi:hypothetical protein